MGGREGEEEVRGTSGSEPRREGGRKEGVWEGTGDGDMGGDIKRGEKRKWLSIPDSTACMWWGGTGGWEGGREGEEEGRREKGKQRWLEGEGVKGKWGGEGD